MANTTTNISGNKLTGTPTAVRVPPNYPVEPMPGKVQQLLEYNQKAIYHYPSPFTSNTNLLRFGREQPYVYRYIDEPNKSSLPPVPAKYKNIESIIPLRAGGDDVLRMSYYMFGGRGVEFITKQLLLQAQQPFDETAVYNPLEVMLATASPLSLGIIPRPQRHVNISGNPLGALASLIGISVANGDTASPSSVGSDALPDFNKTDGRGLLRASTALKGAAVLHMKFPPGGDHSPKSGFWSAVGKSIIPFAVDSFKTFFKPIFPLRQKGTKYRGDEIAYGLMRNDHAGRFTSYNKDEKPVTIFDIRREGVKVLNNNRVYRALNLNKSLAQYNSKIPYLSEYVGSTSIVSVVDTSLGNANNNYRMVRAGAGDGMNQIGVLARGESNGTNISIIAPENYEGWIKWDPYKDDIIAFFFYDIVNEKYIPFRATVKGINDTTTAHWDELRFIGRADQVYTYNGFVRSLAFQFTAVITSLADLLPTWQKINYMKTSLKPAGYTVGGTAQFNRFMIPPMFTLTIGDMYKYQPIVITNFSITIPENAGWETLNEENSEAGWEYLHNSIRTLNNYSGKYAQLPKEIDISVTCNLLEKERAVVGGVDFGHAPRDDDGNLIGGESGKPYMQKPRQFSQRIMINEDSLKLSKRKVGWDEIRKEVAERPGGLFGTPARSQNNGGSGIPPVNAPTQMTPTVPAAPPPPATEIFPL